MKYKPIAAFLFACSSLFAQASVNSDLRFLADNNHSGVFNSRPVASGIGLKFIFKTGGPVRSTPLIADGKLFFGSSDGKMYAIDAENGKKLWEFNSGSAINSSAIKSGKKIFFTNREEILFCLDGSNGKLLWKKSFGKELPYKWAFDYYTSSPTIYNNQVAVTSGDGHLYLLNITDGNITWKFNAGARIKNKPLVVNNSIYFGDFEGRLYSIDLKSKKTNWIFEAEGVNIKLEDWGFDRRAFISSPAYSDGKIFIGNRDGFLYCIDSKTGSLIWKFDHKTSWVLSSPAIFNGKIFVGSSDKKFVNAVDINNGNEIWNVKSDGPVWSSIAITGDVVYGGDYGGNVFAINALTGEYLWKFKTGDKIHSSPVLYNGNLYIGSDDGALYAISGSKETSNIRNKAKRAVYWEDIKTAGWFQNKIDEYIRDYFVKEGYALVDRNTLKEFLETRINDKNPSVVLLAKNFVYPSLYNDSLSTDLMREYLKSSGKIVMLGLNPFAYKYNIQNLAMEDLNLAIPNKLFGLNYEGISTDAIRGWYSTNLTEEGIRWGLQGSMLSLAQLPPQSNVVPLAKDETGYFSMWVKNFGGKKGSGLVQLWYDNTTAQSPRFIYNAVEYGLQ